MFYVGALLYMYSTPPFEIHPTAMRNLRNMPAREDNDSVIIEKWTLDVTALKFTHGAIYTYKMN